MAPALVCRTDQECIAQTSELVKVFYQRNAPHHIQLMQWALVPLCAFTDALHIVWLQVLQFWVQHLTRILAIYSPLLLEGGAKGLIAACARALTATHSLRLLTSVSQPFLLHCALQAAAQTFPWLASLPIVLSSAL